LRKWVKHFVDGKWEARPGAHLKRVKMKRDILIKAVAYFAKEPQ
jgi:hypothetical protein